MVVFDLDESLGYLIRQAGLRFQVSMKRAFNAKGYDLTSEQWGVLCRLWEEEGLTQKEIARRVFRGDTKQGWPSISRVLNILARKKIIIRKMDPDDRRAFRIYLTKQGREIKDELISIVRKDLKKASRNMNESEIKELKRMLTQVFDNLG
ncbi:MarR family winged helix-turn-helix transcriptional regulator [Thermodesulfobacteriota bacterium]